MLNYFSHTHTQDFESVHKADTPKRKHTRHHMTPQALHVETGHTGACVQWTQKNTHPDVGACNYTEGVTQVEAVRHI